MLKPFLVAASASSIMAADIRVAPKYYMCNESTGFCELQPISKPDSAPSGTSQPICLLTCSGTIWPAPSNIERMVIGSTSDFCGVEFSDDSNGDIIDGKYEKVAIDNFMGSLGLPNPPNACEHSSLKPLRVVMKRTVMFI